MRRLRDFVHTPRLCRGTSGRPKPSSSCVDEAKQRPATNLTSAWHKVRRQSQLRIPVVTKNQFDFYVVQNPKWTWFRARIINTNNDKNKDLCGNAVLGNVESTS